MTEQQRSDVEAIAYAVIADLAPEELPYFEVAAGRFRRHPDEPPRPASGDAALGFGQVLGLALSPFALWLTQELLSFAAGQARPALARATEPFRTRLRTFFLRLPGIRRLHRPRPIAAVPAEPLSAEDLARVRSACIDRAVHAGLESHTAELLADAIIGRLALPS